MEELATFECKEHRAHKIKRESSWLANQDGHWTERNAPCVIIVIWHISWGYPTMGKDSFSDLANSLHDSDVECMNRWLRGIEN